MAEEARRAGGEAISARHEHRNQVAGMRDRQLNPVGKPVERVTLLPKPSKRCAHSIPMAPAPTTASCSGKNGSRMTSSLVQ